MKTLLLALMAVAVLAQQDPNRPFPNHEQPPEDWFCSRQNVNESVPAAHVCDCERMCRKDSDGAEFTAEDPLCKVFCHKEHCHCEVTPCDTH